MILEQQKALIGFDEHFLTERLAESRKLVKEIAMMANGKPLIIQFSGGKDSMAMLGLVMETGAQFVCAYMATGLEFPGVLQFVRSTCQKLGVKLIVSNPKMHKGNLFQRLEENGGHFPRLGVTWCCRDLKIRPQKKLLKKLYGRNTTLFKLEGIRMAESSRRRVIYKAYSGFPVRPDAEHKGSFEVFPIINWTDTDVENYIGIAGLPTLGHYNEFGVSGCSLCPFYQPSIYYRILTKLPDYNLYLRAIKVEEKFRHPSVGGRLFLGDIRRAVLEGKPCPGTEKEKVETKPCMAEVEPGVFKPTCEVFGHTFLDGICFRCGATEVLDG